MKVIRKSGDQGKRLSGYQKIRKLGNQVIGLLLISLCLTTVCLADAIPRFYGEELVVTGSRLPQSVKKSPWNTAIITVNELKSFKNIAEAVKMMAGVDSTTYGYLGSLNSIRLRGANASQVLVLVDGRRINSPSLGLVDLSDLLTDNVERVEIVRAPLSAVYGSDAISGVVNIITKTPAKQGGSFSLANGSFGTQQYQFSLASANYYLSGNYLKSDGFRKNGDYTGNNLYGKLNFTLPLGSLIVDYGYYSGLKGVPGVPTAEADPYSATEPNDRQNDVNTLASITLKGGSYQAKIYQNVYDQKLNPYVWGASANQTSQVGIDWQQSLDFGLGKMLYGLEARQDKGKTTLSGDHTVNNYALFWQDELAFGEKYFFSASVRGDKHSTAGTSINPRLGFLYQAAAGLSLRGSAGTAFRAPTLNELYWNDGWMFGDSSLKPEKALAYEIGLERELSENSTAKLNYYQSTVTDMILWDWQSSTIETRAKNVGQAEMEGVEFEYERRFWDKGKAFINYTYQRAINKKDFDSLAVGKTIRYAPTNKYNVGILLGESKVLIRHVGERYADQYNTVLLPAYTVVDLELTKKLRAMVLTLSIENLLDERYSEIVGNDPLTYTARKYPMPGRRYSLGVKWDI